MVNIKNVLIIGSLNMDFMIEVEKIPVPGETILGKQFSLIPGGKGANQAYSCGKLGGKVSMIGAVGDDENGKKLIDSLNSVGVNTNSISIIQGKNTGCAFINVDNAGENNIVVVPGANSLVSKDMIDENIHLIDEADIIVMQLEIPINVVEYVATLAKDKGKMVILDPAPAINDLSDLLLTKVDVMKPNETELEILTGININTPDDAIKAAKILIDKGVNSLIVSLGKDGSIFINKDGVKKYNSLEVQAVDTTAAGDSFVAAFAVCLANGKSVDEAINYAHLVSSIVVTKKGAQSSIPSLEDINNFCLERSINLDE